MRSRDEVIKDFEDFYLGYIPTCDVDEYHDALYKDVLRLQKEQELVVRCKDCKHGEKVNSVYLCGKIRGFGLAHEPDWFCADGERRGSE